MTFVKPVWETISIEPPHYENGELCPGESANKRGFLFELCSATATNSNRLRNIFFRSSHWANRKLDSNFLLLCLSTVRAAMDADEFFFLAFRNNANGSKPFFLYKPDHHQYTKEELDGIRRAAVCCAELGMVLELCSEIAAKFPVLSPAHDRFRNTGELVLIPYYHPSGLGYANELHGVFVGVRRKRALPLTQHAWVRLTSIMTQSLLVFQEARDMGKIESYDPQPLSERRDMAGMLDGVRLLTRENFLEYAGTDFELLETASKWLGFADPGHFHPKRLFRKLKEVRDAGALHLAEETQKTATTMTSSAISQTWMNTMHAVFGGITTVIPDAAQVYFVTTERDSEMKVVHEQKHPLTPEEEKALVSVARTAAVSGEAIFDTSQDGRPVFEHLRKLVRQDVSIVAIPVYEWKINKHNAPDLHGVFVAIRRERAPEPTPAMRLAWTLAAQYLLSPLAAAHEKEPGTYKPVDLEQKIRSAHHCPAFPYVSALYWAPFGRFPTEVELSRNPDR